MLVHPKVEMVLGNEVVMDAVLVWVDWTIPERIFLAIGSQLLRLFSEYKPIYITFRHTTFDPK